MDTDCLKTGKRRRKISTATTINKTSKHQIMKYLQTPQQSCDWQNKQRGTTPSFARQEKQKHFYRG